MDPLRAHRSGIERTEEIQQVDSSRRTVRTLTTVDDTYGLPVQVEIAVVKPNGSTGETLSDQTCTKTSYAHNTSAWLIGLPKGQRSTGTSYAAHDTADPATKLIKAVQNSYDGLGYGETPTKGLVTSAAGVNGAGTSYSVVTKTTYDPLGRILTVTKPDADTTKTQYTPGDTGGPVTSVKAVNAKGHAVITTFDPGRSLALTVTDAIGRVTAIRHYKDNAATSNWDPATSENSGTVTFRGLMSARDAAADKATRERRIGSLDQFVGLRIEDTLTMDLWIDEDDRAKQFRMRGDTYASAPQDGTDGEPLEMVDGAPLDLTLTFLDVNEPVSVEAPPAEDTVDPAALADDAQEG